MPVLAIFGLYKVLQVTLPIEERLNALKWSTGITCGLALILLIFKGSLFSFAGGNDAYFVQNFGMEFMNAVKADRKAIFVNDTIKTSTLVLLAASLIWFYIKNKISENLVIVAITILVVFDLVQVDRRYVNAENFMDARMGEQPFQKSAADMQILQDTTRYRVYEQSIGLNGARTSYFHSSIGGYHGAKPGRLADLADFYLYQGKMAPLNLLNVKYVITQDEEGAEQVQINPQANGNVWFIQNVKFVPDANAEIMALENLNTLQTAVIQDNYKSLIEKQLFTEDTTATIKLTEHKPNYLKYESSSQNERLAVFSEVYYPDGWNAYIDGEKASYFKADYILRAMMVPEGKHIIEFKFEPQVVETGGTISLASNIILLLIILGALFMSFRNRTNSEEKA